MRVALAAFEAMPRSGTEAGLAWNWAQSYLRRGCQVTVLSQRRSSPRDDAELVAEWDEVGVDYVPCGKAFSPKPPQSPQEAWKTLMHYENWCFESRKWLQAGPGFDVYQHLSLSSVRLPFAVPLDLDRGQVVLGPLGGAHMPVWRGLLPKSIVHESLRALSFAVSVPRQIYACRQADSRVVSYATNAESAVLAQRLRLGTVESMLTDGVPKDLVVARKRTWHPGPVQLVWAGRMVASKRPDLAVNFAKLLRRRGISCRLEMIGDGPMLDYLKKLAGDADVVFTGRQPHNKVLETLQNSDYYMFHSMRDSSCPGIVEAAAVGVPTLALRAHGVRHLVPEHVAIGPEEYRGESAFLYSLFDALSSSWQPETYPEHSKQAIEFASACTWDAKVLRVLERCDAYAKRECSSADTIHVDQVVPSQSVPRPRTLLPEENGRKARGSGIPF